MSQTCNGCSDNLAVMPIAQHEKDQNRLMKIIKWLVAVIALLIVLLVGSNVGWLIYESQFETVESIVEESYDIHQEAEGGNNNSIINGGEVVNGEADDKVQEENNNTNS